VKAGHHETLEPPTNADFMAAWTVVRNVEMHLTPDAQLAEKLARVIYAAERARKLLAGIPTCAERVQE
jgi:hypothetical protein